MRFYNIVLVIIMTTSTWHWAFCFGVLLLINPSPCSFTYSAVNYRPIFKDTHSIESLIVWPTSHPLFMLSTLCYEIFQLCQSFTCLSWYNITVLTAHVLCCHTGARKRSVNQLGDFSLCITRKWHLSRHETEAALVFSRGGQ